MPIIGSPVTVNLETILFATDFSPSAESAKLYVQALAQRYHANVRLLHVIDLGAAFSSPDAGISIDLFRRYGQQSLWRLREELASEQVKAEAILCEANGPVEGVLLAAGDKSVDLLVIGTRGHKGLARLILGSTAKHLIHQAKCPIITIGPAVRPPKAPVNFQRIVFATDFSAEAAKAFVFALSFAQDFGAHLYMCHVVPEFAAHDRVSDQELNDQFVIALRRLVPDVAKEWCEPECVLEYGYAADGILLLADRVHADLIVLGTRSTSHWFDNFNTGVAFQVISGSPCPVLTMRE